jgi:thioredoxin 1
MSSTLAEFTDANFEADVLKSPVPVLVDFWATWCGPCKALTPIIEQLATTYAGRIKMGKFNIETSPKTPVKYGVASIPLLLIVKDGQTKAKIIGLRPKAEIAKKLDEILAAG